MSTSTLAKMAFTNGAMQMRLEIGRWLKAQGDLDAAIHVFEMPIPDLELIEEKSEATS